MPIKIPNTLPAKKILNEENIFVMDQNRANTQDIRPLKIVILNIMPTKIKTETQLLRLLSNTPLQVDITLLHPETHKSKNTSDEHLENFYCTFKDIKNKKFDGMIITGAPVEQMDFEEVTYWEELKDILDWSRKNVFSTMFICWGAQAGLYHFYGVPKYSVDKKVFGVFENEILKKNIPLFTGFDDTFNMPHSRHTEILKKDIDKVGDLDTVCTSKEAGVSIVMNQEKRQIFISGHGEYDWDTLKSEYDRDIGKGLPIDVPKYYYENDDPSKRPKVTWKAHANLLFANWLNYYVYQQTPYDIDSI